jgi:hypothetical protein
MGVYGVYSLSKNYSLYVVYKLVYKKTVHAVHGGHK